MSGSVDSAKVEHKAAEATASSPTDLLKKAVAGKAEAKPATVPTSADPKAPISASAKPSKAWAFTVDSRLAAVATIALVIGTTFGMVAAPRERSGDALARIETALEANRSEAARLNAEIERLSTTVTVLREASAASRTDIRMIAPSLTERVTRLEQGLDKKFAALTERVAHGERDAAAPVSTPAAATEKRAAAPASPTSTSGVAATAATPKTEPTQTASISDAKPKMETVENWALRDVYEGVAMLEDRKRHLLEVARGDSVPGVGRVESIERRGRMWVVVTKQGVITPQTW